MKIAILGSRGIPNNYGGFEEFAEKLSVWLHQNGCEVWVYCPHDNSIKEKVWKGINLIHCNNPEKSLRDTGQFIYDLNCIMDSRKRNFDIIYHLGYTSSSVWFWLHSKNVRIVTNMDGMEWKRAKYNFLVRRFLRFAEKLAALNSERLIADSQEIAAYLTKTYAVSPAYIPYGADTLSYQNPEYLREYNLTEFKYYICVGRLQKDNNTETIIRGWLDSGSDYPLLITGNTNNSFGRKLLRKYGHLPKLIFTQGIYDKEKLNNLRHFSCISFHGHSVGGTNPSLLEAMSCEAYICAHKNEFNMEVLGENAAYFCNSNDVARVIATSPDETSRKSGIRNNLQKILEEYTWEKIFKETYKVFEGMLN